MFPRWWVGLSSCRRYAYANVAAPVMPLPPKTGEKRDYFYFHIFHRYVTNWSTSIFHPGFPRVFLWYEHLPLRNCCSETPSDLPQLRHTPAEVHHVGLHEVAQRGAGAPRQGVHDLRGGDGRVQSAEGWGWMGLVGVDVGRGCRST